ncbi:hypothetical protein [Edaphobacillus lindanitolerans]|uniref:Uncharacterized protein n=1 Tax=Edaphobacillus lindanitolerans TaxID=550447 RepID=A0A1U7PNA5_9BACI|nr:hypothetical protein [Edaphobacillus lindanitolerans]SIT85330.1 hypothetical protein SAMN05428946_1814 [Edaphobacillus lindanitolerans]
MKMSEIPGVEHFELFVKFTKAEYVDSLLDGNFYMNNINFYIELENNSKTKGVGDKWEAAHVFQFDEMYYMDSEEDKVIKLLGKGELITRFEKSREVPVYCFSKFTAKDYSLYEDTDEYMSFRLDIGDDLRKFKEFGDTAVIFPVNIGEALREAAHSKGMDSVFKEVTYNGFSDKTLGEMDEFHKGSVDMFFRKNEMFKYQREVRLALYNTFVDNHFSLETQNIKEHSIVSPIEQFLERSAILAYKNDEALD